MIEFIKNSSNKKTLKVTYREALWSDERYVRASWVGATVISFHALTMFGAIQMYSNRLLHNILSPNVWLTPRKGTILIDICNIIGGLISIMMVRLMGRKPLMIIGHTLVTLFFFTIGILDQYDKDII